MNKEGGPWKQETGWNFPDGRSVARLVAAHQDLETVNCPGLISVIRFSPLEGDPLGRVEHITRCSKCEEPLEINLVTMDVKLPEPTFAP